MMWMAIRKPLSGLLFLLAVRLLVPDICRAVVVDTSLNTLLTAILAIGVIIGVFRKKISRKEFKQPLCRFIVGYTFVTFLIMLIPNSVPFNVQLSAFVQFFVCQLLPALLMMVIIQSQHDLNKVLKVLIVCTTICVGYGVVCMLFRIPFGYNAAFIQMFGQGAAVDAVGQSFEHSMGGIAGRILGTCVGRTYAFGMIAPVLFTMVWCIRAKTEDKRLNWLIALCAVAVLFTTRRSPIITASIFVLIIMIHHRAIFRMKYVAGAVLLLITVFVVVSLLPEYMNFKHVLQASLYFWDERMSDINGVGGSSVSFRLYQLKYTLKQITDTPLIGNGWGSCYYKSRHPSMIGWESIVFTTLMQGGIYGAVTTLMLYFNMYKYSIQHAKTKVYESAFILSSVTLCLFTDTIYTFFIFCGCILLNKINRFKQSKLCLYNENSLRH